MEVTLESFIGTDVGFLESVEFTSSANDFPPIPATFIALVKSSATHDFDYAVSWERSDIVSLGV